jgi:hypothetical protein
MSLELKIAELNKIEQQGLSVFEFDQINWWPLIRIYLFQNHEIQKKTSIDKKSLIYPKRVLCEIRIWREQQKRYRYTKSINLKEIKKADALYLTSETNYKKDASGSYINRFLDPLYLKANESKTIWVRSKKQEGSYVVPDLHATEFFELKLKLKKQRSVVFRTLFFLSDTNKYSYKHKLNIDTLINYIKSFPYFTNFNFNKLPKWFDDVFESHDVAKLLFQKIQPKQFIQYCYYFPVQFGYTLAANSMQIKSVDYQHGIQNKFHYGYGSWANVPKNGFQLLPNEFWVFSEREKNNLLSSFSNSSHKVKVIGNAWVDYWKEHKTNFKNLAWLHQIKSKGPRVVLYTVSNYLIDKNHFFWQYLQNNNTDKLFFLFRLHPGHTYLKEALLSQLHETNFKNFNIDNVTKAELYDLIEECDIHITQNSSVAEEALFFNKSTIVIDPKWSIYFENYISNGDMFVANSISEFENLIHQKLRI